MVIFNSYASLPEGTSLSTEKSLWPNLAQLPLHPSVQVMLKPSASVAESVTKRITKLLAFHGKIMEHPREISEFSHVFLQRSCFSSGMMKCGGSSQKAVQ